MVEPQRGFIAWITKPFRALRCVQSMDIPVTFRWCDGKHLTLIEIELQNEFGVPHGKITEAMDIKGSDGNALSVTLHLAMTLDGDRQEPVAMALVPEAELDELRKFRCLFNGHTWRGES